MEKICTVCCESLDLSLFYNQKAGKHGRMARCKCCVNKKNKEWANNNRERVNQHKRNYRDNNKEKADESKQKWLSKNKNHHKDYYKRNREKLIERTKERFRLNPIKVSARAAVTYAIKAGNIIKPDQCELCERHARLEAHHCDYSKKLDVMWICRKCHVDWHKNNEAINGD